MNSDLVEVLRSSERNAPDYLSRAKAHGHERPERRRRARGIRWSQVQLALEHERRAVHHRVFCPYTLAHSLVPARRLELGAWNERDDRRDAVGRDHHHFVAWIVGDATPMRSPNIRRNNERATGARRSEGTVVAKLVEPLQTGVAICRGRSPYLIASKSLGAQRWQA